MFQNLLHWKLFKAIAMAVLIAFVSLIPAQTGYTQTLLPKPGEMVGVTNPFTPPLMLGLRVDVKDPFNLYFVMSQGQKVLVPDAKKEEYKKLIKYFLASLITPNKDMWVNLSPKEADRIIPDNFSMTEMGRDLLAQDYLLKQFTASLISPETPVGKQFWAEVYKKAHDAYGTADIPVDTFNKVWITADKADIYQKNDTAILVGSHLKVMLEQDFMAVEANKEQFSGSSVTDTGSSTARKLASDVVRNVIVPVIEKEVNEGSNFAEVRQIYNSMILATWFKKTLKESLLGQMYVDESKVAGIALNDPQAKDRIYRQYLEAYKTGVFNYIKEEMDTATQETLPRKYFSGGMVAPDMSMLNMVPADHAASTLTKIGLVRIDMAAVTLLDAAEGKAFGPKKETRKKSPGVDPQKLERRLKQAQDDAATAYKDYVEARDHAAKLTQQGVQDYAQMPQWLNKFTKKLVLVLSLYSAAGSVIQPAVMALNQTQARAVEIVTGVNPLETTVKKPLVAVPGSLAAVKPAGTLMDRWTGKETKAVVPDGFELVTPKHSLIGHKIFVGGDRKMEITAGMLIKMGDVKDLDSLPKNVFPTDDGKVIVAIFNEGKTESVAMVPAPTAAVKGGSNRSEQAVSPEHTAYQRAFMAEVRENQRIINSLSQAGSSADSLKALSNQENLARQSAKDLVVATTDKQAANDPEYGRKQREQTMKAKSRDAQLPVNVALEPNYYQGIGTFKSIPITGGWHANIKPVLPFAQELEVKGILQAGNLSTMSFLYVGNVFLEKFYNQHKLENMNQQTWLIRDHQSLPGVLLGMSTVNAPLVYGADNEKFVFGAERIIKVGVINTMSSIFGLTTRIPVIGPIFGSKGSPSFSWWF